jgi:hypothetical protein
MADEIKQDEAEDARTDRSRRQLLAGAVGAVGAIAVASIAKATPVSANTGDSFKLGNSNFAGAETLLENNNPSDLGFTLLAANHGGNGTAIDAFSNSGRGVIGRSGADIGVLGNGSTGVYGTGGIQGVAGFSIGQEGVFGQHGSGSSVATRKSGVHGVTYSTTDPAILGENVGGADGVSGSSSGSGAGVSGTSTVGHGVHGVSNDLNGNGVGVLGEQKGSSSGIGVYGVAAIGVQGTSNVAGHTGVIGVGTTGVYGQALPTGIGVLAAAAFDGTGQALEAVGTANFQGRIQAARSGLVRIQYPNLKASVAVSGGLTSSSLVLATMQNTIAGTFVVSAVPNVGTGKATITLNQAPGSASTPLTAKVAWFVVN